MNIQINDQGRDFVNEIGKVLHNMIGDYNQRHQMPYKIKVDQKVLLKNQRRMDRKGGKFSFKWFSPFAVHSISNKNLCSLINKYGTLIKTKYNVYLLKSYLDSDETNVTNDEPPPSSATDEQRHDTENLDPPSLTDKQILLLTAMRSLTYLMKSLK